MSKLFVAWQGLEDVIQIALIIVVIQRVRKSPCFSFFNSTLQLSGNNNRAVSVKTFFLNKCNCARTTNLSSFGSRCTDKELRGVCIYCKLF